MNSKSKLGARVDVDRINQLPDELIYHILSFLPTVDSVRTTVLSTRWRSNLWTFVNTFDINYQRDFADMHYNDFANFVNRALSVHGLSNIEKFRLACRGILAIKEGLFRICYDLPPSAGCFSSLRSLYLWVVDHDSTDIEKLINKCCPVLEELELGGSIRIPGNISHFNISALKLKRFTMDFYFNNANYSSYALINATKLENLYVKGIKINFILENPKSLAKAEINLSLTPIISRINLGYKMTKLLAGLSGVKDLYIRSATFETCRVPAFDNLMKLELILDSYRELVTQFLKRSPNLEHLILELDNKYFRSEKSFIPPEFVPVCLSSHLKTVYMRRFNGWWVELEVLNYLLGYGQVLDELIISSLPTLGHRKEESLYKELLQFRPASRTCEVKFV